MVGDAVIWVHGKVVKYMGDGSQGELIDGSFLGYYGADINNQLVVYVLCII